MLLGGGAVAAAALHWRRSRRREGPDGAVAADGPPAEAGASKRLQDDLDRYGR